MEKDVYCEKECLLRKKGSTIRSKFYQVKRFLLGEGSSIMRSSLRKKSSFYEEEIILVGKESSIMRRKCFCEKEFCQEKEVLSFQRITMRREFYYGKECFLIRKF